MEGAAEFDKVRTSRVSRPFDVVTAVRSKKPLKRKGLLVFSYCPRLSPRCMHGSSSAIAVMLV